MKLFKHDISRQKLVLCRMYFKTLLYLQRYTMTPRLLLVYSLEQMQLEAIGAKQKKCVGVVSFGGEH